MGGRDPELTALLELRVRGASIDTSAHVSHEHREAGALRGSGWLGGVAPRGATMDFTSRASAAGAIAGAIAEPLCRTSAGLDMF